VRSDGQNHAEDFVITRRRKLYKFARFDELSSCFQLDNWLNSREKSRLLKNYVKGSEVVMEIGAGSAFFSVELARQSPDKTFLAVDIKSDRLYQGAKLAEKLNLKNIYFIRAEIARIGEIMPPHSVAEIWLTFPDPWPPKSDARRRLTAPRYLALYRKILASSELAVESEISTPKSPATANSTASSELAVKGGFVHFKTDNLPLFEWSLEQFMNNRWTAEFVGRDLHNSTASDQAKIMTSYEKRFMAEGLKINYAKFSLSQ
jgi:tRNA (guanine-N7-)-methyltransferase